MPEPRLDRTLTPADKRRIRAKRDRRQLAAHKANVAIGWVDSNGKVSPRAQQLPKNPQREQAS